MIAPAVKPLDWALIRNQLNWLNEIAMQDLAALYSRAQAMDPWTAREYLTEGVKLLVDTYGGTAGEVTAEWWNDMSLDDMFFAQPAPGPPPEQVVKQVRWGTAPMFEGAGDPLVRLSSVVQQHIFGAQRNTVKLNCLGTGVRYARYAQPDACAFCRLLASRGAVYGSAARAKFVGMGGEQAHYSDGRARGRRFKKGRVRGVRKAGESYHDHCRCVIGPELEGTDLNLPSYYDRFAAEYDAAVEALPDGALITMQAVTAAMRANGAGA
ncbi:hypothetical protein [Corynebacterium pygosceleis]|uniref:VG15 protein n=1 Tax=Corynebacterium pygosceleis TaxID=2800406 RepID=UPI002003BDBA|nr:hypothetical protein [Corynebacterium pygosceleis]MCK7676350.1 hypothetical protein [Corynebacterium pygosceleis]